ncbi:MAG: hypothetical protein JSV90_04290 [Methanobacteriota archaeon]|nr:MAG: hypothetical protein JSV90_04290 [Euryarchaeota archaeon]
MCRDSTSVEGRERNVLFFTMARNHDELNSARLFAESLREFGGQLNSSPIWLFEYEASSDDDQHLAELGVDPVSVTVPDSMRGYELAAKVHSCAEAERLVPQHIESLVWISPDSVVVSTPDLYVLDEKHDVAVRPVHVKNVGLTAGEPLDAYWSRILETTGAESSEFYVESYVDHQRLRGYFNSHSYCVRPSLGLFRRWSECFERLVHDGEFQSSSCSDDLSRIFLHQAVLSALTLSMVDHDRIRILPPAYCYPYNLHSSVAAGDRIDALNQLTSFVYEDLSIDPDRVEDIEINEPLRSWLKNKVGGL